MPATRASSFAPLNACLTWTDGRDVFVEVPGNPAAVFRFPLSDNGLWKALNLLRKQTYEYAGEPMIRAVPLDPKVALATSILKKAGVL